GGQRLAPQLGRLHGVYVGFGTLGVRNLTLLPFPSPIKYRQNCRTRHLFDDVDQHTPPPRPLIVQGISHPPQGVSNWHSTCI
ncbi:MAG TPA: hypothetical protein DF729_17010, partial [Hafnia paralvei]|nr:hypothetical protein [Hafnia paralvei]